MVLKAYPRTLSSCLIQPCWNPCSCGYFGDPKRECRCHPNQVRSYRQRPSGPLIDRIDIPVDVPSVQFRELSRADPGEPSAAIRARVERVRAIEAARFAGHPGVSCNANMTPKLLNQHAALTDETRGILESSMDELNFFARSHDPILKVACTSADLAGSPDIVPDHLYEAVNFRTLDRNYWV